MAHRGEYVLFDHFFTKVIEVKDPYIVRILSKFIENFTFYEVLVLFGRKMTQKSNSRVPTGETSGSLSLYEGFSGGGFSIKVSFWTLLDPPGGSRGVRGGSGGSRRVPEEVRRVPEGPGGSGGVGVGTVLFGPGRHRLSFIFF